jgi:LuxR family maltose regulon positive regulatory protein
LKSLLKTKHPGQVPNLNQHASQWFEENQFSEEAIQHAFAAEDNKRVARLIEDYGLEMLQVSKYSKLSGWLESLPTDLILKRPWLCIYQAWTRHWAGLRIGGEDCLENAEKEMNKSSSLSESEEARLSGYIAAVRAHYALTNENLMGCIQHASKALRDLPKDDYFVRCTAGVALGGAYWGKGTIYEAEKAFTDSASEALMGGYKLRASSALCYSGMQQVKQARLIQAEKTFLRSLALVQDSKGRFFPNAGFPLSKLGELECEWNNLDQAYEFSVHGVELCQQLGHVDLLAEANASLARVQLARNDFSGVEETLAQTDQFTNGVNIDPWAVTWLDDCRIRLWLSTNRLDHIHQWMNSCGLDIDGPINYHHDLSHINLARVLIALSEKDQNQKIAQDALSLLNRLSDATEKSGWLHHKIQIMVLIAKVCELLDERDQAIDIITHAVVISEPSKYIRTYIGEGKWLGVLLNAVLEAHQISPRLQFTQSQEKYIKTLLSTSEMSQKGTGQGTGEKFIEPLTDRELDVLRFLVTNKTVPEIADELVISPNTVRSHVKHIYEKLGVHRRLSAVQKAKDLNLV